MKHLKYEALKIVLKTWIETKKGIIMKIKKTVKAQNDLDADLQSLKGDEVVQVLSTSGETPVVGLLITQDHYMELVAAQNSPANLFNKEVQSKFKEANDLLTKASKVVSTVLRDDKTNKS